MSTIAPEAPAIPAPQAAPEGTVLAGALSLYWERRSNGIPAGGFNSSI